MKFSPKYLAPRILLPLVVIFAVFGWKQFSDDTAHGLSQAEALRNVAALEIPLLLAFGIAGAFGLALWLLAWRWLKPRIERGGD